MASVSTPRSQQQEAVAPAAPLGLGCPFCYERHQVSFSRLHRHKPAYKRAVFAYLRCCRCQGLFRSWRIGPLLLGLCFALALLATVIWR